MSLNFLVVHVKDGKEVIINIDHIVSIGAGDVDVNGEETAFIETSNGESYWLNESYESLKNTLMHSIHDNLVED